MHDIKESIAPVIPGSTWITIDKNVRGIQVGESSFAKKKFA